MAFDLIFDAAAGVGNAVNYITSGIETGVDTAATFDTIDGPLPVLDFGDSTNHGALFRSVLPESYDSTASTTVKWYWHADTANEGSVKWEVYFMRLEDTVTDLESTTSFNLTGASQTDAANTTAGGEFAQSCEATISHANMNSVAAGEEFYMLVVRDVDDTSTDTMTGDACLHAVKLSQA